MNAPNAQNAEDPPNRLFVRWLEEWRDQAPAEGHLAGCYRRVSAIYLHIFHTAGLELIDTFMCRPPCI